MVKISSIPEGASIVVNNLPMGKAPFTIEFEANEFDCFVQKQIITALPQEANLFTQARVFPAFNASNKTASEIPSEIIFDMTKPATDSEGSKNK